MRSVRVRCALAGLVGAIGALFGDLDVDDVDAALTTNSWTNSVSSKWETPGNWLLGVAPTNTHAAILITNATTKTVTIDVTTTNTPTMTISNLVISAPASATNTLLLNNAGLVTPLRILNAFTISGGGALTITNSTLRVEGSSGIVFTLNGNALLVSGSIVATNSTSYIGFGGNGSLTISNGTALLGDVYMGLLPGSSGTMTVAGGTNQLSSLLDVGVSSGATGAVLVTGGQLVVTNATASLGGGGIGRMTVSNGTVLLSDLSVADSAGSAGTLTVAGGTNQVSQVLDVGFQGTGTVWVTGGRLVVTNESALLLIGSSGGAGTGRMTVSNGTVLARHIVVGLNSVGTHGTLTVAGGTSSVYSNLTVGNAVCTATGIVSVVGGALRVTNAAANAVLEVLGGTLTQSGGTLDVDRLVITNPCAHVALTGGTLIYGILDLSTNQFADADGDGMSNNYELEHGLDPLDPTDAGLDYDNDGQSNLQEHEMGTDPNDANSYFHISSIIVTNKNVLITWNTATMTGNGLSIEYYVLWGTNLTGGVTNNLAFVFVNRGTPITSTNYLDVGGATNRPPRFYRVLGRPNIG